jgi:hypothetical protein
VAWKNFLALHMMMMPKLDFEGRRAAPLALERENATTPDSEAISMT